MYPVLLVGAGKIGSAVAKFLADTGDYDVRVIDVDPESLGRLEGEANISTDIVDVMDPAQLAGAMAGRKAVLSAVSFAQNPILAAAALEHGLSYFDLTEDVETTRIVRGFSERARPGQIFMPQCGLAPGFVSIAAYALAEQFDSLSEVRLRVGALPVFPTNEMKYNLTWSTDGLINEYGNPCEAIHEGRLINVLPLEGLEQFSLDGVDYEAFNTSGGVGTLAETLQDKAHTLNYKTVRYRGHRDLMKFLMFDLRMNEHRAQLKEIFERAVPMTPQDVVLIFCTVKGVKDGRYVEMTDARKVYAGTFRGQTCSAIQTTTAAAMCAVLDMHVAGQLPTQGFVKQEQVSLKDFLANRFGVSYDVAQR
ncbi:saccharopine dehydrogenase C-terminal domain-containing protein [Tundrisphaera sp. TA3]|uniref:saccharopine dehydrogenase family protein n=1 Tax=Tundrisphaera sp. TA3 TaxID=3435775 RepID=UPI003EC0B69B